MRGKIEFLIATVLLFAVYFGYIPLQLSALNEKLNLPHYSNDFFMFIGWIMVALGVLIYLISTNTFFKIAGNTPLITHPTKKVMRSRLYSKTRNPMYIGHLILIFGEFLITGALLVLGFWLFTAIALHLLVVLYEEPLTKKRLGKSYTKYLSEVPRWF